MIYPLLKFSFLGNLEMLNHALIQLGGNVPPNVGFQWTCVMVLFISKLFSLSMRKWVLLGRFEAFVENHILIFLWKQHPSYFHEACSLKCFECSCTVETHHSTCHLAKCCTPNLGKQLTVTWFTLVEQYSQTSRTGLNSTCSWFSGTASCFKLLSIALQRLGHRHSLPCLSTLSPAAPFVSHPSHQTPFSPLAERGLS